MSTGPDEAERVPLPPAPVTASGDAVPTRRDPAPARPSTSMVEEGGRRATTDVAWRLLVVGGAAGLMAFGFFVLPWIEVGDGRLPVHYRDAAGWFSVHRYDLGGWASAYHHGLAFLQAAFAVAATATAVGVRRRGWTPRWCNLLAALLFGAAFAAFAASPVADTAEVKAGTGPMAVVWSYLLLIVACPVTSRRKSRPSR
ncbi:hypothetical protein [Micromonospora eburnea]|uniref:hypothetical protein n=1 Tax=Micromonospora eburnea TaxID=227316 RepID=UPI001FC9C653|nr:hypothetical protein [Micromonospora eburnea]